MALITILGATGRTGAYAMGFALERGHSVTALVRTPEKVRVQHERLTLVQGDAGDVGAIERATPEGTSVVLSALGNSPNASATILEDGARYALSVMHQRKIRRLVVLSAGGMRVDSYDGFALALAKRLIVQRIFAKTYADAARMEGLVRASDTDWTILAAPRLVDETEITPYRSAIDHNVPRAMTLSRIDFADAMVRVIDQDSTFGHYVAVGK
jgi:putative NADH-flavin reductase